MRSPLKPSIKLAPLITNRKQKSTNIEENIWLDIRGIKNGISKLRIFIGNMYMKVKSRNIIIINLEKEVAILQITNRKIINLWKVLLFIQYFY